MIKTNFTSQRGPSDFFLPQKEPDVFTENKRLFYLDVLRVIACLCVIMIHTSGGFVTLEFGSVNFWVGNICDSLAQIGVPLFVMISGSVFLDENYSFTISKLIRHIKKMVIFFVFWSLICSIFYNLLIPLVNHDNISFRSFLASAVLGHYHLWFCFMIVGLYLIVPLLRLWVKKENITYVRYFLVLAFIFTMFIPNIIDFLSPIFPAVKPFASIINKINIRYVGGYTVYFILGWYLNNYAIKHKKTLIFFGILSVAISCVGTAIISIVLNEFHTVYGNLSIHIATQAVMVYVLVKKKYSNANESTSKAISFVSKHSLGIYAIHIIIVDVSKYLLEMLGVSSAMISIPIAFITAFLLSLFFSFIISKIPLLKHVV